LLAVDSVASVDSALLGERVLESASIQDFEHV
jgi:hypothetical protein